jgi:hypothetical protein
MPLRPRGGAASSSQGRPHSISKRALQRGNVVAALAAARELQQLSLIDALELTILIARKDRPDIPCVGKLRSAGSTTGLDLLALSDTIAPTGKTQAAAAESAALPTTSTPGLCDAGAVALGWGRRPS